MSPELTPTDAPAEGQAPEDATGPEPTATSPEPEAKPAEGKVFDEAYVKQIRKEAASARTELANTRKALAELQDAQKTDTQRLTERAEETARRNSELEARVLRYDIAAKRGLDLSLVNAIAGTTEEEIEANAAVIAERLAATKQTPSFDGGARTTPDRTKSPEEAHNDFLYGLLRPAS